MSLTKRTENKSHFVSNIRWYVHSSVIIKLENCLIRKFSSIFQIETLNRLPLVPKQRVKWIKKYFDKGNKQSIIQFVINKTCKKSLTQKIKITKKHNEKKLAINIQAYRSISIRASITQSSVVSSLSLLIIRCPYIKHTHSHTKTNRQCVHLISEPQPKQHDALHHPTDPADPNNVARTSRRGLHVSGVVPLLAIFGNKLESENSESNTRYMKKHSGKFTFSFSRY